MKRFFAGSAVVVVLDQVTKALAHRQLAPDHMQRVIGEFVRLRYVRNEGAAFSLFRGSPAFFIAMTLVSIGLILYLMLSRRYRFPGNSAALGLILGGAIGNLIDRIRLQQVIDFLDVGIGRHRWPTFNVADIGVTLGVLYLAVGFIVFDSRSTPGTIAGPASGDSLGGPGEETPSGGSGDA